MIIDVVKCIACDRDFIPDRTRRQCFYCEMEHRPHTWLCSMTCEMAHTREMHAGRVL